MSTIKVVNFTVPPIDANVWVVDDLTFLINPIRQSPALPISELQIFFNPNIECYETDKFNPKDPNGSLLPIINEKFSKQPEYVSVISKVTDQGAQVAEIIGAIDSEVSLKLTMNNSQPLNLKSKFKTVNWIVSGEEIKGAQGARQKAPYP